MSNWSVREVRVRFRELLEAVIRNGPQIITRRGISVAVLVSIKEWQRLQTRVTRINLKSVLLARKPTFVLKPRQTRVNLPQKKATFAKYVGIGNLGIRSGRNGVNRWLRGLRGR